MNTPITGRGRTSTKLLPVLLASVTLAGCQSTGYLKSDSAAWHLETTASSVSAESQMLDTTIATLNDLTVNPSGDLRVQFDRFSQSLDKLSSLDARTPGNIETLRKRGGAYFAAWNAELAKMNDGQVRDASAARKAEVSSQFEKTVSHYSAVQTSLSPLISYLNDIRKALSTDLTVSGVQATSGLVQTAGQRANSAKQDLAQTAGDLNSLGGAMSFVTASAKK
jgi:hypothetical protein